MEPGLQSCNPGEQVTITCTGGDAARPQVVRVCETSRALGDGVDCSFNDAGLGSRRRGRDRLRAVA